MPDIKNKTKSEIATSLLLRKLAHSITNPVTIKGTVPKNIYDDVVKPELKRGN